MRIFLLLAACFLATSAGGAAQTAAPVTADPADLAAFVGEWAGGYVGEDSGRQGTVVFRLAATGDSVRALVLMVPRPTADDPMPDFVRCALESETRHEEEAPGLGDRSLRSMDLELDLIRVFVRSDLGF